MYALKEKWRLVRAIGKASVFVASEPEGRKRKSPQVEPFRIAALKHKDCQILRVAGNFLQFEWYRG